MKHRLAVLLATLVLASCGYTVSDEVVNGQAVATVQKPSTDFTTYATFTVAEVIKVHNDTTSPPVDKDAKVLADQVKGLMTARGYQYVQYQAGANQNVDLFIAFDGYVGTSVYGGYWCDWYYWGYSYGCYPYYAGSYQYGTLILSMGDRKNATAAVMPTVWGAAIYSVLGSDAYNVQIAQNGIDRAFAQSPYLHK